jgi:WD40 repeat protein
MDRSVRLWDLSQGTALATSRPHGGLVRCVDADSQLLVSGCSDGHLRAWRPSPGLTHIFDVAGSSGALLQGHLGPVTSLSMDSFAVYSGSWDYTLRTWSRADLTCLSVLKFDDWVHCVAARGGSLLVSAGGRLGSARAGAAARGCQCGLLRAAVTAQVVRATAQQLPVCQRLWSRA